MYILSYSPSYITDLFSGIEVLLELPP